MPLVPLKLAITLACLGLFGGLALSTTDVAAKRIKIAANAGKVAVPQNTASDAAEAPSKVPASSVPTSNISSSNPSDADDYAANVDRASKTLAAEREGESLPVAEQAASGSSPRGGVLVCIAGCYK